MRTDAGQMVKGTLWVTASRLVEGVVALAYSIVVARWLQGDYGYVGAAMGVFGVLNVVSHLGIPQACTRYVAAQRARGDNVAARETIVQTLILETALSLAFAIGLALTADSLARDVFGKPEMTPYLGIVVPMVLVAGVAGVWLSVVQGLHRYPAFALQTSVNPLVRLGGSVLLLALGLGVEGALLGFLLGHVAALLLGLGHTVVAFQRDLPRGTVRLPGREPRPGMSGLVRFGMAVTMGTVAMVIFEWTDKLMLTAMRPIEEVAFYTIAFGMVSIPLVFPRAIGIPFFPMISSLHGAGDAEGLRRAVERVMGTTLVLMAFVPFAMMAIAPWIVGLLYGEFFLDAVAPFLILSVWGLVRAAGQLAYNIPKGVGRPMVGAWAMVLTAALNVGFNALLIPPLGVIGAALATTASYMVGFTYLTNVALRMVGARFPWSKVLRAVASAAVAAGVMLALFLLLEPHFDPSAASWTLIPPVLAVGFGGLGIYILMLGLTNAVTENDAKFVREMGLWGTRAASRVILRIAHLRPPSEGVV